MISETMSKDKQEKDEDLSLLKNWSYDGNEDERNNFDRRMQ